MASTHVTDKLITSKTESHDDGGVREERQEEKGEEVNMGCINEGADSVTDQGSGSQEATGHQDTYARPDLTKKVRASDRERRQIGDTEDSGPLEVREETEDRGVNIYECVGSRDVISRPQEDMLESTAGSQPRGQQTVGRRLKDAAPWILLLLCVILLFVITGLAMHYNSANKKQILDQTLEIKQLQHEVDQLKEAADKMCTNGWQMFGSRCYQRSPEEKTWEEGRQHCLKAGADLVIINRKKEQEFIKSLSSGSGASWIGLNNTEGKWTWVDGTRLTTGYWASGRPDDNTDRNCVKYNHFQEDWIDAKCGEGFRWICEK